MNDIQSHYDRLKTLYSISKDLSTFVSVEVSFSKILTEASASFPLLSAVLIEHWEKEPKTAVWFSADATQDKISAAVLNAKNAYSYLAGSTIEESADFLLHITAQNQLNNRVTRSMDKEKTSDNYIVLPLMIDNLPPKGALQLEGAETLDEQNLEFVDALATLLSVALDRYYKTNKERISQKEETKINLDKISTSAIEVENLEIERGLREDFVSLLTHDLRTPISVIMGSAELIMRKKDSPDSCYRLATNIVGQSKRVARMISDLLDANHIRSGEGLALKLEEIDLNALIKDTISQLVMVHGDRFIIDPRHQVKALCDSNGIRRIIENLCSNAIKYGFSDTPVIISIEDLESNIKISVRNQGEPIPKEEQKNIFEQFRRTENALRSSNSGWGIGLTLVRGVAEAHGGSVEVESSAELGTTFTVLLPKSHFKTHA